MMWWFLLIDNIDQMHLCVISIEIYIHLYLAFYLNQEYIDILKIVLFIENLAISQLITFNNSMIIQEMSSITIILNIKTNQVINGIYNAVGSPNMNLTIIKI